MEAAEILRRARDAAGLSQTELARRAGVSPSVISDYECARFCPTVRQLDRLLAAAGFQLAAVEIEPLDADLDARVRRSLALPFQDRIGQLRSGLDMLLGLLDGVPFVLEGAVAALLQGAPVTPESIDVAVPDQDDVLTRLAANICADDVVRYLDETHPRPGWIMIRPRPSFFREFGPTTHWRLLFDRARIRLVGPAALPPAVHLAVHMDGGGLELPAVSLWQLETTDSDLAAVLTRSRELAAELSPGATAGRTA